MSYGYLIGVCIQGALVALTLRAPRRPWALANLAYRVAAAYNEAPFFFAFLIVLFTVPPLGGADVGSAAGRVELAFAAVVIAGLGVIAWRGAQARPVVQRGLDTGLGPGWRDEVEAGLRPTRRPVRERARIVLMPFVFRPRAVERVRDISYGGAGRANLLDVYRHRSRPEHAPVLVYFHGGGFYGGRKSVEGRALLFRLARQGWVTVSANYRLRPDADFFDHLADAKKVIAWVRRHGHEHGADPSTVFLSGGSAGGTLSTIAGLTQNHPRYQPGFEDADTSVTAVASFYGWYSGYYGMGGAASEVGPLGHDAASAPPFFIAHGRNDSLAYVETARCFVDHLRRGSPNAVVYAELPGGQHAFDLFRSLRFSAVVDGLEAFAAWVRARR